jgi:predicted alpha/beta hydrolase family esterase
MLPFFVDDFDWPTIGERASKVFVYAGSNDPYVPMAKANELADLLETQVRVVEGGGHLNAGAGLTEFPELLAALDAVWSRREK